MRSLLRVFPNQFFADLGVLGLITGLVTSKVVLSVATIMLMCNAFINIRAGENFKKWFGDTTNLLFIALFLVYLLSGFYSSDTGYWIDRCRMKLPFLALPLGFTAIKSLTTRSFNRWLAIYFYVVLITAIVVFINYLAHFALLNEQLRQGQPIPSPLRDHIRFSLEVAFAIVVGGYIYRQRYYFFSPKEKYLLAAGILFLAIFIHVFAVRSGILAFYLALLVVIAQWVFRNKKYLQGLAAIICIAGFAFAAARYIPSLKNRIDYFNYEMDLIRKGELNPEHSDAQRLLSIEYGWQIARENLIMGIGVGDIKNEMDARYRQHAGSEYVKSKLPHNQFIYILATTGSIGMIIFLLSVFYPWWQKKHYKNVLYSAFMVIMLFSFMAEHTLEIQLGSAFYLLFLLLIKKYLDDTTGKPAFIITHA